MEVSRMGMVSVVSLIRWFGRYVESEDWMAGEWLDAEMAIYEDFSAHGRVPRWFDFWIGEELDFTHDAWLNSEITVVNLCNATGSKNQWKNAMLSFFGTVPNARLMKWFIWSCGESQVLAFGYCCLDEQTLETHVDSHRTLQCRHHGFHWVA